MQWCLNNPLVAVDDGSNPMTSFGFSKASVTVIGQVTRRHRRSTSAGMHLLCGAYMFGSSRTQRVVSLSSCESELHGMVSTLADGLFLRRCAEFITRATIEHYLLTDSSSARQLAARQGVGKIKHLSAKILWIQNLVQEKDSDPVPDLHNLECS